MGGRAYKAALGRLRRTRNVLKADEEVLGSTGRPGKLGLQNGRWPGRLKGHEEAKQGYKTGRDIDPSGHVVHSNNTKFSPAQRDAIRHKSQMVF